MKSFTLDKFIALDVHCFIPAAVTEVKFIDSINKMDSEGTGTLDGAFVSVSWLNRSAFACCSPGL